MFAILGTIGITTGRVLVGLILFFFLFTGCLSKTKNNNSFAEANGPTSTATHPSVAYFIQGQTELTLQDLQPYSDIIVVQTFDEFKQYANQKIALWIDKGATPFTPEQQEWMNQAPQAYYPTVLVGSSNTLHSFRDLLGLCCFMGPSGDNVDVDKPGFSVILREETSDPASPAVIFIQSYDQTPTVQAIFEITKALLEGRLNGMPTVPFIPPSTPTIVP